ncbi:MAG: GNAT family N-acetyltransferase [Calditrichaeota bacterium]|nr:GNAT family N-acetyltransferase [Calditrichota bacterium]
MGQGAGARLFRHAVAALASHGIKHLKIVSDPHAEGFYQKMGARRVGAVASSIPGRALPVLMYEMEVDGLMG